MASEWQTRTVDGIRAPGDRSIAIGPFGSRMKADTYVANGVPVIRGTNISGTRALDGEFVFVSEETADQLRACNVHAGDLVFPHRGAIGQVAIVPSDSAERFMLSTSLMKLTCDTQIVDPKFIFYFFRSPRGRQALLQHASTVGTPGIGQPLTSLRSIRVPVPPLDEQRAISHILGTLDDKIELSRRMNATLETMARALFTSWFVDFDPVRANAEGGKPDTSTLLTKLFPDSFEDSELGEIPRGWEIRRFADTLDIMGGGTPKTSTAEYWNGDIPWFSVADAPNTSEVWVADTLKKITQEGADNSSTRILPVGTTIVSARGTVGKVALVAVPMAMNQSCYGLRGKLGARGYFTFFAIRELVTRLLQHAHGSVFNTITRDTLAGLRVVLPLRL
jgi:restriction endonuclease S subunit